MVIFQPTCMQHSGYSTMYIAIAYYYLHAVSLTIITRVDNIIYKFEWLLN